MCFAIVARSPTTRLLHSPLQAGVGATDLSSEAVSGWLPDPRQPAMQASSLDTEKLNLSPKYPYIVGLFNQSAGKCLLTPKFRSLVTNRAPSRVQTKFLSSSIPAN